MTYLSFESNNTNEMEEEFQLLKTYEPRIFILHTPSLVNIMCWFHRFGFVGPQYAFVVANWILWDPNNFEIPKQWSWCTKRMVLEVARSIVTFGDGLLADVSDDGPSLDEFYYELMTSVVDATEMDLLRYSLPIYYDKAYLAGLVLNETETILQQERNETLSDWLTNTEKFQQEGHEIAEIIKRAHLKLDFDGFKGTYRTKMESRIIQQDLFQPVILAQLIIHDLSDVENVSYEYVNFDYYGFNSGERLNVTHEAPIWRTFDGKAPKDSIIITNYIAPMLPVEVDAIFKVIYCIFIILLVALGYFITTKKKTDKLFSLWMLILGDCLLLCHSFFVPTMINLSDKTVNILCYSISFSIANGFSLVVSAFCSIYVKKRGKVYLTIWNSIFMVIFIIICATSFPFLQQTNLTRLDLEFVPNSDQSEAKRPSRWECVAVANMFSGSSMQISTMVLLAILAAGTAIVIANASVLGFRDFRTKPLKDWKKANTVQRRIRKKIFKTRILSFRGVKRSVVCLYCQLMVAIAMTFISFRTAGNFPFLLIATSVASFVFICLHLLLVFAPKAMEGTSRRRLKKMLKKFFKC